MISIKDLVKMIFISVVICCAAFVCTMFLSYNIDLTSIKDQIPPEASSFYDAIVNTGIITAAVSGGCLVATSVVLLIFYIKNYIDNHLKELGILKCLGYSNFSLAKRFWVFGLTVFAGAVVGFVSAYLYLPRFYGLQNKEGLFPDISVSFHIELLLCLVVLPSLLFCIISVLYALINLNKPALSLIKEISQEKEKNIKFHSDAPFLKSIKKQTLKNSVLTFFIVFSSFCFSAMMQMSASMKDLSSEEMGAIMLIIGILLSVLSMFLSLESVMKKNAKTLSLMKAFGYSNKECADSVIHIYRPYALLGFGIGTVYQYGLLKLMVKIVFAEVSAENPIDYHFDFLVFALTLIVFVFLYELTMVYYKRKINKVPIKAVMQD